ncbi:MAG: hypothetical protein ACLUBZ_17470 [Ruthenibacterium lactatiformans]|uniref:hypothetical protein n=1 Tax=Ruthenibacterium lactatiformans TaxID=1550024 RepID=UPI00399668EB
MEFLTTTYEMVANYFMMIKVTDVIDMAIIAFVVYNDPYAFDDVCANSSGCAGAFDHYVAFHNF